MAGKSVLPLLVVAGGAALLMSGKKKKKSTPTTSDTTVDDPFLGDDVYIPPEPAKKPKATAGKPAGRPPRGDDYDPQYWGATSEERLENIRQHFVKLGYSVEVGPWPMNKLGPKGSVELENQDGSKGKLGGNDDQPNAIVRKFQGDYNKVSRLSKADKIYSQNMGGLDEDGLVGPLTLNGLRFAVEGLPGGKTWDDLLLQAANKGIV